MWRLVTLLADILRIFQFCEKTSIHIYHDDFLMPGISPRDAISRKQILHKSKSRKYPCLRPHRKQRRTMRVENFGVFFDRAITDFFAILIIFS
jgi:hypothetical protein